MPASNLYDLFKLAPDQAIKWFESKGNRVSWNWMDVWQEQHAKAFTVAKSMSFDILEDIRQATEQALKQGLTNRQYRTLLTSKLKSKGWWGKKDIINPDGFLQKNVQFGSPWRLNTIYQTNTQSSMMSGRWKSFYDNKENRPYLQYITRNDSNVRPTHALFHKKIFHIDNPIWNNIYPPNGFSCRCRVRALTEKQAFQRGFKKNQKSDIPEGFPDDGFSHNNGLGQVANDIKGWQSWYKLHNLKNQPFVDSQLKLHIGELINIGFFAAAFDKMILRDNPIGEKLVTGYLNKRVYDSFNPRAKHGAIIIPDKMIPKGIDEKDWRLLPDYLIGNKTTEVQGRKIIITFKQRNGNKKIKLTINTDMEIVRAQYEN